MQCHYCRILYVGKTQNPSRRRMNRHRNAIGHKEESSPLYNHLLDHFMTLDRFYEDDIHVDAFSVYPIEQIPDYGDMTDNKLARQSRETFWIDTLCTMKPHGLNQRREYDLTTPSSDIIHKIPFVIPFSKTANMAGNIVKKHLKILKDNDELEQFNYDIIMAYSKHKTIGNQLISSKS